MCPPLVQQRRPADANRLARRLGGVPSWSIRLLLTTVPPHPESVMCDATARAELLLPMQRTSPALAREFARRSGCADHALEVLDDALLLISELVTNSVLHGGPPIVLAIDCDGTGLHVRVRDGAAQAPVARSAGSDAENGRGMSLVELLSDTWGVQPVADDHGVGKEVWFELRPGRDEPSAPQAGPEPTPR